MSRIKFKVVLLGEGRVGKTSLLVRYIYGSYSDRQQSTRQASYLEKRLTIGTTSLSLAIWDTAGQEKFHALAPIYYRDSNAALIVYDITDRTSFMKLQSWVSELRKIVGKDIILCFAANKEDLRTKQQVPRSEAEKYASEIGATHVYTSAKSGKGVEETFLNLAKQLVKKHAGGGHDSVGMRRSSRRGQKRMLIEDSFNETEEDKSKCC